MQWLVENWFLLVAAVAVFAMAGYAVYVFVKKPTNAQIESVKKWLLYAVTEAEKALGSGTGKLKLRYVYDMFISKFPWLAKAITFEMLSILVDEALDEMKKMLESNEDVKLYVNGGVSNEVQ